MLVMGLFVAILISAAGFVTYMATHGENNIVTLVEHEVDRIRRQSRRGWKTRRILRHHRSFCACQVEYLRRSVRA
jgi:hypothetical protein